MTRPARRSARGLLLDEMLSGTIAEQLPERGLDVIAVVEDPSLVSMPDEDLPVIEAGQDRLLVTANIAAFAAIATDSRASGRTHPGWCLSHRTFPQDRSFLGALVSAGRQRGPAVGVLAQKQHPGSQGDDQIEPAAGEHGQHTVGCRVHGCFECYRAQPGHGTCGHPEQHSAHGRCSYTSYRAQAGQGQRETDGETVAAPSR